VFATRKVTKFSHVYCEWLTGIAFLVLLFLLCHKFCCFLPLVFQSALLSRRHLSELSAGALRRHVNHDSNCISATVERKDPHKSPSGTNARRGLQSLDERRRPSHLDHFRRSSKEARSPHTRRKELLKWGGRVLPQTYARQIHDAHSHAHRRLGIAS